MVDGEERGKERKETMMKEKVGERGASEDRMGEAEGGKKGREKNRGQEERRGEGGLETREEKNDDAYCLPQPGN